MLKIFLILTSLHFIYSTLYSNELSQINLDSSSTSTLKNGNIEQIPDEILSVEFQMFFNSLLALNYEKKLFTSKDLLTINFETGLGINAGNGEIDAITMPLNIRAIIGKKHCIEIGSGIYLNYFLYNKRSNSYLSSDFVKLRFDVSYRYHTTFVDEKGTRDTDMFKFTLGMYYMFNEAPMHISLRNGGTVTNPFDNRHQLIFLGFSLNLWTL